LSFGSAKVAQAFAESAKIGLPNLVCFGETHQYADTTRLIALLSKNTKRPRRYGAAKNSDELASFAAPDATDRALYLYRLPA